ncbi:MAG: hypothetical protein HS128_16965 [Ideonella sp.]|nr:hypothetical protein [Ideonella sp.]
MLWLAVGCAGSATAPASLAAAEGGAPAAQTTADRVDDPLVRPWPAPLRSFSVQLPGMSHHFDSPIDKRGNPMPGRKYNERNWGIGLQIDRDLQGDWQQWVAKTSFGVMKDSLDAMGAYAGQTWQKRLLDDDRFAVELGGGGFVFYRTLKFGGPHRLVPAVLPVLSVTYKPWQFGVNLVAVPRCRVSGGTMPNVLYMQFTKSF